MNFLIIFVRMVQHYSLKKIITVILNIIVVNYKHCSNLRKLKLRVKCEHLS